MIFKSPSWVPDLPIDIPNAMAVGDLVLAGVGSQRSSTDEEKVLTDPLTDETYSVRDLRERVDYLSRGLGQELGWSPGDGQDKVVGIFSFNTIDYIVLCWAIHRLNGTVLTLHPGSSVADLQQHFTLSKCKAVFTCQGLVDSLTPATAQFEGLKDRIYYTDAAVEGSKTIRQLIAEGSKLAPLKPLSWQDGQGARQLAFLAPTSGTSGTQKLAKITHFNIIANILQATTHESFAKKGKTEVAVLVLPMSHAYALEVIHMMIWRGDHTILHPQFHVMKMLESVQKYNIERLYLVPAIISSLAKNDFLLQMFDCSSVHTIVSGAGPLTKDVAGLLSTLKPDWKILAGYGLTETSIIASLVSPHDIQLGSSGSLLPLVEMRLINPDGQDVSGYDQPGEVLLRGPNNVSGYLNDELSTRSLIDEGNWLHTGDIGLVRPSTNGGAEHVFIIDRLKDMIKVNGFQVAPTDIERVLMTHSGIKDVAVIGVPEETAGERAQAYVVRASASEGVTDETALRTSINNHVEAQLSNLHWLGDRIIFIDEIPRNQGGKILKEKLKQLARSS